MVLLILNPITPMTGHLQFKIPIKSSTPFLWAAQVLDRQLSFLRISPEDIRKNLTKIFENLRKSPLPIRTKQSYGLLDEGYLRSFIFAGLFLPYTMFPTLGRGLASLAGGEGRQLFLRPPPFKCHCKPKDVFYYFRILQQLWSVTTEITY
ncbi:hypothetical protein CPB83DRAFT_283966 [Crepidotus variabilis]|uniref:Uncharacterized protein n=1 Tax=Crepidotus variabilis TaxID=179855 RepID=A0A9P6EHE2_9AGAR|nr:hypothetical protein CPB83DRAFT_283966 [Crepidotus variabilis]